MTSRGNERREVFRGDEDRAARDEAIYRTYIEGRFTQREIGDHLGLHYVTLSGIVRAKEKERRGNTG